MLEHRVLDVALVLAFLLAPWMTNRFFFDSDRRYANVHGVALVVVVVSLAAGSGLGAPVWALFCAGGFAWHLLRSWPRLRSVPVLASFVPFAFSMVSAVWFVAGTNDLALLGYNRAWSFYAALHGSVLGWLYVGCVAFLAQRPGARPVFLWALPASFVLFLCVAFGIDGVPYIKRVGVVGFAVLVPGLIALFAKDAWAQGGPPVRWSLVSLAGAVVSMGLALGNEYWLAFPRIAFGMSTMALTHGLLNVAVVVPCFFFAVRAQAARA